MSKTLEEILNRANNSMQTNPLDQILEKAKAQEFVSFNYVKDSGERSRRTVRFGIEVAKKMERQGTPISGVGNWHKNQSGDYKNLVIKRGKDVYVRGTDTKDSVMKIFKLEGISDVK